MLKGTPTAISNPVYQLREAMGRISQDELGRKIGVCRAMIIRYEKGKSAIPDRNDSLTRLFKEYGIFHVVPQLDKSLKSERAILGLFNRLGLNEKIKVIRIIEQILHTSISEQASDAIDGF